MISCESPKPLISGFILKTTPASAKTGSIYSVSLIVDFFSPTITSSVTLSSPSLPSSMRRTGIASIFISPFSLRASILIPKKLPPVFNKPDNERFPSINEPRKSETLLSLFFPAEKSTPSLSKRLSLVSIIVAFI